MNEKQLATIKEAIEKSECWNDEDNLRYTARFIVVGEDGDVSDVAGVCHAQLGYGVPDNRIAVVNGHQTLYSGMNGAGDWEDTSSEDKRLYLDWLLNRSPYASTFFSKNAIEAVNLGYTISRTDVPANLMAAGLVATRRMWEYTPVVRVWVDLVKGGVNENFAYYLAHLPACNHTGKGDLHWNSPRYGHCSIDSNAWGMKAVKNFINNKPTYLRTNYDFDPTYRGYGDMFCKEYEPPLCTTIHRLFPYDKGNKVEDKNPFKAAKVAMRGGVNVVPYDQGIQLMIELVPSLLEKINA